jgi:hypothetical protein
MDRAPAAAAIRDRFAVHQQHADRLAALLSWAELAIVEDATDEHGPVRICACILAGLERESDREQTPRGRHLMRLQARQEAQRLFNRIAPDLPEVGTGEDGEPTTQRARMGFAVIHSRNL